ncbi:kazal-type serine protease inhibitor domain-containing protein 1-like isoform X1 [Oncorhynchus masou masou]|uniref:kazal-type serine protease inhibitor domain-containing protein 1-like isoform X1 n=1 Tax=Oncorhynchus masou masou TaxID=90313 RepID=UPI003182D08F
MAWAGVWLCMCVGVTVSVHLILGVPPQHRGWLRLWEEGEGCGECERERCPLAPSNCPAGQVQDSCGCCEQCGNVEGQQCDPDGAQLFYGRCGEGLVCQRRTRKARRGRRRGEPEPKCVCEAQGSVCGSDGRTYPNLCQLREAASRKGTTLRLTGQGPCYSAPRISRAPRDLSNYTGNDIVFGCEVSAFPLPNLSWRKKGSDNFLPGDDPHISVQTPPSLSSSQARGGPQRYTVSTWLQIQNLHLSDAGIYSCISHNALGETSASARLTVLRQELRVLKGRLNEEDDEEEYYYDDTEEGSDDGQTESGDYLG